MSENIYPQSQNSVVLSAADWDSMGHLLKSTISALGKDGAAVVITMQYPFAQPTIEATLEFTD